jgi:hypothetical protein
VPIKQHHLATYNGKTDPRRALLWLCAESTYLSETEYLGAKVEVHIAIKSAFSTDRAQKADVASYAAPPSLGPPAALAVPPRSPGVLWYYYRHHRR